MDRIGQKGRIYKFTFTDTKDPTKALFEVIMDGNDPMAHGYNMLKNPDNVDTSTNSLMINEDFIDANRLNATAPYDITNNAKILRVDIGSQKTANTANNNTETIAYVNQSEDLAQSMVIGSQAEYLMFPSTLVKVHG